jgi:lysophospholipase L1-like esterase
MNVRAIALACLALAAAVSTQGQRAPKDEHWVSTWSAASTGRVDTPAQSVTAPAGAAPPSVPAAVLAAAPQQQLAVGGQSPLHFSNQTLRQIAHVTIGGVRLRVVLSNIFGTVPLNVGAAQLALRDKDAAIVAGSNRVLTFNGLPKTAVPAGAVLLSDPVDLAVPDFGELAVDLYLPDDTAAMKSPITIHPASWQTNYVSTAGNHAGSLVLPVQTTTAYRRGDGLVSATWFFLSRIEVSAPAQTGVVVALGDSITDGTASGIDMNRRWPDDLAGRLAKAGIRMAVVNAGIGGNRILNDGNGPSALARFDRDVVTQPGVTHAVVLEGINDIGQARANAWPSAADLIAAHTQMIERAHVSGIRIAGATLTPFEGAAYWTPEGEAKRQALNDWIRTSHAYDTVFDFDAAVRDPSHQRKTRAEFDAGDHLHLNAAGYQATADAIDLAFFRSATVGAK